MTGEKMTFYSVVLSILCVTALIGGCTYAQHSCKLEGIKANKPAAEINALCR